jgi:hypothetical protein
MDIFFNVITFASIIASQSKAVKILFIGPCGDHYMLCICTWQTIFTQLEVVVCTTQYIGHIVMTFFILHFKIRENSLKFAKNSLKFTNFKMQNEECHHYDRP